MLVGVAELVPYDVDRDASIRLIRVQAYRVRRPVITPEQCITRLAVELVIYRGDGIEPCDEALKLGDGACRIGGDQVLFGVRDGRQSGHVHLLEMRMGIGESASISLQVYHLEQSRRCPAF